MKILLVVSDPRPWSTSVRANAFKKRFVGHQVDIVSALEIDIHPLIENYDIVHILYSGGATSKHRKTLSQYPNRIYTSIASLRTLQFLYDSKDDVVDYYRNSKAVVALNPELKRMVIRLIGQKHAEKVHYIPNGVDESLFKPKPFVVGFVGCSANGNQNYKGLPLIQEACKRLGAKLLIQDNQYPNKITPHHQMPAFYKKIDCLAIASLGEGSNNPTMEALSMNKPVISTREGIAEELEGVILVERSVESIEEGLRMVYTRKQILEKYTWDIIAKQYFKLYEA